MEQVSKKSLGNSQGIRISKDIPEKKQFVHKSFEERLAEYNGEISVCDFDWGEPVGREFLNEF